ncbi:MAG: HlyD family secretion protein [Xanthobacteraceae bacterium]|nr:HlyD family secretion protein [Xanthobacteraceae bacterium]
MADPALKLAPDQAPPGKPAAAARRSVIQRLRERGRRLRERRRLVLLVIVPILAVIGGVMFYLSGGRYATTDDAYVGAQKVLITPEVSGKIIKVVVKEGQRVKANDELFEIDPEPYRTALLQAEAALETATTTFNNLKSNLQAYAQMLDLAQQSVELKQRDVDRKQTLVKNSFGSQLDLDNAGNSLVIARSAIEYLRQQVASTRNQLLNNPDLPLDQFPPYRQAAAALADAKRNLDHTVLRAPIDGVATQVDSIQLGRFTPAGTPVFSVIDVSAPWVDANLKESDFTYLAPGQPVTVSVDAFPDHEFKAVVSSLSPGTGAQFAILPPQNATGNFVKVVQRVPVRIAFDKDDRMVRKLKAGMSAYVWIDTGHRRSLASLIGLAPASAQEPEQDQ